MKKILLFAFLLCTYVLSYSQVVIPKGKRVIGGSVSIGTGRNHSDTSINDPNAIIFRNFHSTFNPTIGWAKKENQLYGVMLYTEYATWKHQNDINKDVTKGNYFAAGPGVFYERFFSLGKGFNFSADGALRVTYGTHKQSTHNNSILTSESKGNRTDINFSVTPRIGYAFNEKWMVQASIGELLNMNYSNSRWEWTNPGGSTSEHNHNNLSVNTRLNRGFSLTNIALTFRYSF